MSARPSPLTSPVSGTSAPIAKKSFQGRLSGTNRVPSESDVNTSAPAPRVKSTASSRRSPLASLVLRVRVVADTSAEGAAALPDPSTATTR